MEIKNTYTLEIIDKCPSWNYMMKMHWKPRSILNKEIYDLIAWQVFPYKELRQRIKLSKISDCWLHFHIHYKENRKHDCSNAYVKHYEDGLVRAGVIVDDNCKFVHQVAIATETGMPVDKVIITILEL